MSSLINTSNVPSKAVNWERRGTERNGEHDTIRKRENALADDLMRLSYEFVGGFMFKLVLNEYNVIVQRSQFLLCCDILYTGREAQQINESKQTVPQISA
ncbi:hypothetical protein PZ895_14300 [Mesorhizobium sp. YIM 152430]|uniref:hypothetical protein n=1 Tax=Mesorhizobium sp. YIM 152430 TaxID=3031761 RepID=UPI0023DAAC9B|nr:hypothetical protein [Mesorhizobium sp. YIM 152430]MDF1600930.1 hypothetical protein [Mesorhizobium sp. YIM 152430]